RLESGEDVARVGGVKSRETATVTAGHGLDEVERFATTKLADDDAVRTHAEGDLEKLANRHLAASLGIRGTAFERHDVIAQERELLGVFDDDYTLVLRNQLRHGIQKRGFSARRTAGDDHVLLALDEHLDQLERVDGHGAEAEKTLHRELLAEKTA